MRSSTGSKVMKPTWSSFPSSEIFLSLRWLSPILTIEEKLHELRPLRQGDPCSHYEHVQH
jgi:hypothetical protein